MTNIKTSFISNLIPSTSYGLSLFWALHNNDKQVVAYSEKDIDPEMLSYFEGSAIIPTWQKSHKYFLQIINQLKKDRPKVVHIQHELNIYGSTITSLMFPFLLFVIKKILKIKLVVTVHALPSIKQINKEFIHNFKNNSKISASALKIFFFWYYKSVHFLSDKIIVHTNLIKDIYTKDYFCNQNKIYEIPIGCHDLTDYSYTFKPYFFYMGYLVSRKGLDIVLDGFYDFIKNNPQSNFTFKIAGSAIKGQEFARNQILEIINYYPPNIKSKIEILGFINQDQVDNYYKNAYAVVIPSKLSIAGSGPLSWAFSYGKCIIASNNGNLKQEIADQEDGLLVDNDFKSWSNAFSKITSDFSLVKKLQAGSINKAKQRNWDLIAKKHLEIYKQLIG